MATKKKTSGIKKSKADIEMLKSSENFLIEKEKRYQKKVRGPQVEQQTVLKETKKPAAGKKAAKKK
jgi:hypothetical protein